MDKKLLKFNFKGDRDYVQGPDIYNQLVDILKDQIGFGSMSISLHDMVRNNLLLKYEKPESIDKIKVAFKFVSINGSVKEVYLVDSDVPVTKRYAYDENKITSLLEIDTANKVCHLNKDTCFSFIENVVAMNKYLIQHVFPEIKGKLVFTKLNLNNQCLTENLPLSVKLRTNFNNKMTRSIIFLDNKEIGDIMFNVISG